MLLKYLWILTGVGLVLLACRPTPASSPPDLATREIAPAQVATPTPTPTPASISNPEAIPRNTPTGATQPPVLPPPFRSKPPATVEESIAWQKEMEDKGFIGKTPAYGPTRKGVTVTIKGINIKLPEDTYIEGLVVGTMGVVGQTPPETPYYVIVRGNSRVLVTERTGRILREILAKGEENAFDFLKRAIQ